VRNFDRAHDFLQIFLLFTVIADLGGLLGLFMGASIISFIEIIFGLVHMAVKKSKKQHQVEVIETSDYDRQSKMIQKLSLMIQTLHNKQEDSSEKLAEKLASLEQRMEKLSGKGGNNDEILKSLEEMVFNTRRN
jgi:hypothetical protein